MVNTKVCKKCNSIKPVDKENFQRDKKYKDGFKPECKECSKKMAKEYYEKHKEEISIYNKRSREKNKETISASVKAWEEKNKEKRSEYHKLWYQANKKRKRRNERKLYLKSEKHRKYKLQLCKIRSHRKRSAFSDFTPSEWESCTAFFDNECCYCGRKSDKLQQDHFVPVAKGGAYTKSNIVPSCGSCNSSKNDRDFLVWYRGYKNYSSERELKILRYLDLTLEKVNI